MTVQNKLKFNPAVELSYLAPQEQEQFYEYIQSEECTPSLSQAQQLKAASKEKSLNEDKLTSIMTARAPSVAPREQQISIPLVKLERFFPKTTSAEQIIAHIIRVLEGQPSAAIKRLDGGHRLPRRASAGGACPDRA